MPALVPLAWPHCCEWTPVALHSLVYLRRVYPQSVYLRRAEELATLWTENNNNNNNLCLLFLLFWYEFFMPLFYDGVGKVVDI